MGSPEKRSNRSAGDDASAGDDSNLLAGGAASRRLEAVGDGGGELDVGAAGGRGQLVEDDLGSGLEVAVEGDADHRPAAGREVRLEPVNVDQAAWADGVDDHHRGAGQPPVAGLVPPLQGPAGRAGAVEAGGGDHDEVG